MKKLTFIAFLFFYSLSGFAQSYGSHINLYLNALLMNTDDANPDYFITGMFPIKKLDAKYSNSTDIKFNRFIRDTLKVIAVKKTPYSERPGKDYLILQSLKNGNMYAYEYFPVLFPFKVVKQGTPVTQDEFCSDIEEKSDKFSDLKVIMSPTLEPVMFQKAKSNGPYLYYINCRTGYSSTSGVGKKGVTFLFTDGTKKVFPDADIDVKVSDNKYTPFWYSCNIELNEENLKLFSEKKIQAYRLYIADRDISDFDGIRFQAYLKCIAAK